ncbi:hypothetical protein [Paenibacillus popilliae]|uniref:P pilus assembly protein n=1 Tax=Paenibacillus popilliae ATCC 14706 TaxID=1212764 RepID=M9M123_PAEPP|nr:hypothetical protein [Paenibacillus popilliae]BAQ95610.1 hypothetical protein [Paenibacillus popilliae ATCC 14706]GAC40758.1 P pilus assembly protein [Paenibacillus popilliae ATCC 14706]
MKKVLLVTALAAPIILSATSASAQEVSATTKSSGELVQTNWEGELNFHNKEEKERVRRSVDKTWNSSAVGGANVTNPFKVNPNNGHLKLLLKNLSKYPVNVNLQHIDTNKVYFATTIDAKSSLTWKNWEEGFAQGMRTGNYYIQWSGGEHNVNGKVFGKLASETDDF